MFKNLLEKLKEQANKNPMAMSPSEQQEVSIPVPQDDKMAISKDIRDQKLMDIVENMTVGMSGGVKKLSNLIEQSKNPVIASPEFVELFKKRLERAGDDPDALAQLRSEVSDLNLLKQVEEKWIPARSKANEMLFRDKQPKLSVVDSAYDPSFKLEDAGHVEPLDPLRDINKNELKGDATQVIKEPTESFSKIKELLKKKGTNGQ